MCIPQNNRSINIDPFGCKRDGEMIMIPSSINPSFSDSPYSPHTYGAHGATVKQSPPPPPKNDGAPSRVEN